MKLYIYLRLWKRYSTIVYEVWLGDWLYLFFNLRYSFHTSNHFHCIFFILSHHLISTAPSSSSSSQEEKQKVGNGEEQNHIVFAYYIIDHDFGHAILIVDVHHSFTSSSLILLFLYFTAITNMICHQYR